MKAGRELDTLIAEKVMGYCSVFWRDDVPYGSTDSIHTGTVLPFFSRDISAAWEVVEKVTGQRGDFQISFSLSNGYAVGFGNVLWSENAGMWNETSPEVTAPLAICLAALKAVGVEV